MAQKQRENFVRRIRSAICLLEDVSHCRETNTIQSKIIGDVISIGNLCFLDSFLSGYCKLGGGFTL